MPVISAKDLNLWYGDFKALKGISLDVGEQEITALIGPSGCGKSTFLKTLNRMNDLVPNVRIEGDVRLRGEDIFVDAHGEGVRLLEDHAHAAAQVGQLHLL